jgi:glycine dehydrogenase subunit 2
MNQQLIFEKSKTGRKAYTLPKNDVPKKEIKNLIPEKYIRTSPAELPEVSENEVIRHFINLSSLNYHIDKGFYPLGSCTMKYNPKINEVTAAIPNLTQIHPLQKDDTIQGSLELMYNLSEALKEISGLSGVTLQPAAGAQGELTGLLLIRKYHSIHSKGQKRSKILVPDSAHGTNPASAAIAGFETISIKSNEKGTVDIEDLKKKVNEEVAGMMLTNPNTLGIFESDINKIEKIIHEAGGLLYMDGANFNALLGIARPGDMGFDVVHINLHKTFSTPHGGGGPGAGPVAANKKLAPFLPIPVIEKINGKYSLNYDKPDSIGKIHSFYGNFGIFIRAYTYILSNGGDGLKEISKNAIINANYLLSLLKDEFELPYKEQPLHEFVLSSDRQKKNGVTTLNIAKRLLDYGYHAPTIYFPLIVHEALMIEPTESESKETLDSFAETLIKISEESRTNPEIVLNAPQTTPVKKLDDALASRQVNICFKD